MNDWQSDLEQTWGCGRRFVTMSGQAEYPVNYGGHTHAIRCLGGNDDCRPVCRSAACGGCNPQKLNERPMAPRNTLGVGHPEWSEHARAYHRSGDVVILAPPQSAVRVEGQVRQALMPYADARNCNARSTVLELNVDAIPIAVSANPGTPGEWCRSLVRKLHSPLDYGAVI